MVVSMDFWVSHIPGCRTPRRSSDQYRAQQPGLETGSEKRQSEPLGCQLSMTLTKIGALPKIKGSRPLCLGVMETLGMCFSPSQQVSPLVPTTTEDHAIPS